MVSLLNNLYLYFPIMVANAAATGGGVTMQTPTFITNIVGWAAGLGGGIVAIFLVVSLVKDGIEFARGQGSVSIWKILGKAIFLILIIGLIFLALNYQSLGNKAKSIGDKAINTVNTEITNSILK